MSYRQTAAQGRAALQRRRDHIAAHYGEPDRKPKSLSELQWRVDRDGCVLWNGSNVTHFENYIDRFFRALPGPMPTGFPRYTDARSAHSREVRSRNRVAAEILRETINWDRSFTNEEFPPTLPTGAALTQYARDQDEEVLHTASMLYLDFADDFWCRLDAKAAQQYFSADQVCDWIEAQTDKILARDGVWPRWALLPSFTNGVTAQSLTLQSLTVQPQAVAA